MEEVELGVLGPLELRVAGSLVDIRPGIPRTILICLLLRRGETVSSQRLIDVLWGEQLPVNPANALQAQVSYLRKRLAAHAATGPIVTRPGGYSLEIAPESIDAHRFEEVVLAVSRLDKREPAAVHAGLANLDDALGLWRGQALVDVSDHEFAIGEATRLEELRLVAIELRSDLALELGRHRELIGELTLLVGEYPFRERLRQQLMLSLYRSGRQTEALRAYAEARRIFVDELGIEPGIELRELERRILEQDPTLDPPAGEPWSPAPGRASPAPAALARPPHRTSTRLPAAVTSLIGRDVALERVAALLETNRLVTLTGPAGAGKTRLAIEAARRLSPATETWFVDLGEVVQPDQVATVVARALDVPTVPGDDTAGSVALALAHRKGLLLLDTCEHLLSAVAVLVGRVLREADDVRVLATSRRPLTAHGEVAWPVPPLALPPPDALEVDELIGYASIALFVERAMAVRSDFELTADNAEGVLAICTALDGLPLAIELAAARVDVLSPAAINERLQHRFDLLVDGGADTAPRHQTLRGAVQWSANLLDDATRTFFARLGVFAGSFDLEAAAEVGRVDGTEALELMRSLVRHSMVAVAQPDRYRLLDTLGAYALEILDELDADATRDRHATCFVHRAERAERGVQTADQARWLEQLRVDVPNHLAAIEWLVSTGNGADAARLAGALGWFWTLDGMLGEADRQLERVLGFDDLPPRERSKVLWSLALLASSLGQVGRAEGFARESVACGRQARDPVQRAYGLNALAVVQWAHGDLDGSEASRTEAISLFRENNDVWGLAVSQVLRARTAIDRDDPDTAKLVEEGLAAARVTGDRHLVGIALAQAARLALRTGDPPRAIGLATDSLDAAESIGYLEGMLAALHLLGLASLAAGLPHESRTHHLRALRLAVSIGHAAATCEAVEGLAHVALADGRTDDATELAAAVDRRRRELGLPRRTPEVELFAEFPHDPMPGPGDGLPGLSAASLDEIVDSLIATVHGSSPANTGA